MELKDFSNWLDNLLMPGAFKDYCVDGLCVEASDKVTKVVTGVSFRDRLIDRAIEEHADAIVVHHPNGFWNGDSKIPVGHFGKRIRELMKNGISLYGFHLPLDGHPEIGNNALIAGAMGLKVVEGFMQEGEKCVGQIGEWDAPVSKERFVEIAGYAFPAGVQNQFMFGTDKIRRVAICSGSGASGLEEAIALGCDAFVTGEIKESVPIAVEEAGFNLIACGHHRTEVFGVRALAEKITADLGIPAVFVDIDNPI
jgi:dinuclear metal center YbgI/SA1388 family protein